MIRIFLLACLAVFYMCLPLSMASAADFGSRVSALAEVKGVRVHAGADKVRIVVDADHEVDYKTTVLQNPGRVVVDLSGAWLSPSVDKVQSVSSPFASKVRIAQHNKDTVRIVVETTMGSNEKNYDVFSLQGGAAPYRIVLDFGNLRADTAGTTIKFPAKGTQGDAASSSTGAAGETAKPVKQEQPKTTAQQEAAAAAGSTVPAYSTTPGIAGKCIAIDPGHGGNDSGAIGPTGITEKSITLRISQKVQQLLEASGAKVFMTRATDTEVSPKHAQATDDEELQARCDVANDNHADIFVCIHMDSFSSGEAKGTTGYYYADTSGDGQRLADAVRAGVVKQVGTDSRGTKSCHFYVLKHTTMPATLVEVAFVSNPKEEQLLNTDAGQQKAAQGIVDGIAAYFGG